MNAPQKTCPQCGNAYDAEQRFCPRDGSTLRAPPGSDLVGSVVADRYLILKRIGEGGMGQVYLAEHIKMKRKSAVKVMHQGMVHDPDAIQRFNREASNASSIQHPHVAAIYDFGETPDGLIYLAMEFVDGEPLTKIIERQGALPAARAAEITRQTAEALESAHEMGIVHRDLKPDNIMIARGRAGEDVVKVVDFGIAKAMTGDDQKVTKTGLAIGTPEYMSPEQLGGDQLDSRTDIYSLGLVAFNMFTGQLPFPSVTSREALIMRLTERPRTLAEIRKDVQWPEELQWVMDRALANHPGERYQHVSQFGRDLAKAVAAMPQSALSQQGTLAISAMPVDPAAPVHTDARAFGRASGYTIDEITEPKQQRATTNTAPRVSRAVANAESTTASLRDPEKSRVALYVIAFVALAFSGGGLWYLTKPKAIVQLSPAATAPSDSASAPHPDSLARLAAAAAAAESAAAKPAAKPRLAPLPPPNLDELLAPIKESLDAGEQRQSSGEYEVAAVKYGDALDQLTDLLKRYPDVTDFKTLKKTVSDALTANRDACLAERKDALERGNSAPECP